MTPFICRGFSSHVWWHQRVPYSQVILASHNASELLLLVTELGSPLAARLLEKNHNFWIFLMGESIINIYKLPFSKAILTLPEGTLLCLAHGMAKNRSTSTSGGPYVLRLTFVAFQAPFSLLPLLAGANSSDGLTWQRESRDEWEYGNVCSCDGLTWQRDEW